MQHILSARLLALNPGARPRVLSIEARQAGDEFVVGRTHFSTGEDTIISRRHARFKIISHAGGPEMLVVENLSMINGMLVNLRPIQPYQAITIYNGDEICFSGAHGLTEETTVEALAEEAQRYRYRLVLLRGVRNAQIQGNNSRKRDRDVIGFPDETASRLPKRRVPPWENVIELSSDPEEPTAPNVPAGKHNRGASGRQISPVSVSSTADDSEGEHPFEELDDEVFENEDAESEPYSDLVDTSLDEDEVEITGEKLQSAAREDTTDELPESSAAAAVKESSKDKGKGKAVEEPIFDLQEELESSILLVPHICSPCGHVLQWRSRSDSCPQCRVKLSSQEPFVRDYILERVADKYARLHLPSGELTSRDIRAIEFNQSQRQKKEDAKKSKIPTWAERARELGLAIPASQQNYTAEDVLARRMFPPGWSEMNRVARDHFSRWRVQVLEYAGAPVVEPVTLRHQPPRVVGGERRPFRDPQVYQPIVLPQRDFMRASRLNAEQNAVRGFIERNPDPPAVVQISQFNPNPAQSNARGQRSGAATGTMIDNEWLREVGQAFGAAADIQRLQMENLQVLQAQAFPPDPAPPPAPVPRPNASRQHLDLDELQNQLHIARQRGHPASIRRVQVPQTEDVAEDFAAVQRLLDERVMRRQSAPTPTNVSPAAVGGAARNNPWPS